MRVEVIKPQDTFRTFLNRKNYGEYFLEVEETI
jgi:hypothetical protein